MDKRGPRGGFRRPQECQRWPMRPQREPQRAKRARGGPQQSLQGAISRAIWDQFGCSPNLPYMTRDSPDGRPGTPQYASGWLPDQRMTQDEPQVAPSRPQNGPKRAQDGPNGRPLTVEGTSRRLPEHSQRAPGQFLHETGSAPSSPRIQIHSSVG